MRTVPPAPVRTAISAVMTAVVSIALVGCASSGTGSSAKAASGQTASAAEIAAREQTADQQVQHVLNRLAFGPRPGDVTAVRTLGVDTWIARQLEPEHIDLAVREGFDSHVLVGLNTFLIKMSYWLNR